MSYGHHEILLLLLHIYLTTNCTINEDSANNYKCEKGYSFKNVFSLISAVFQLDGCKFGLIGWRFGIQLTNFELAHQTALFLQYDKPPNQCSNDINQKKPVNTGCQHE